MSSENKKSKCASCVCTGCHNFKDHKDKEEQLNAGQDSVAQE